MKLFADVAQAFVDVVLAAENVAQQLDDKPDSPSQDEQEDHEHEDGKSGHEGSPWEKKIGERWVAPRFRVRVKLDSGWPPSAQDGFVRVELVRGSEGAHTGAAAADGG
jgi:hypothetical protein